MTNTRDLIIQLKLVRKEKELSITDIENLIAKNGDYPVSRASISRVFADGSEDETFMYEKTIKPIANAVLDVSDVEDDDTPEEKGMKYFLRYKKAYITELERRVEELETALDKEKIEYLEKIEEVREQSRRSIEFLKDQLAYKDKRMDEFMYSVKDKDKQLAGLMEHILNCPFRKGEQK